MIDFVPPGVLIHALLPEITLTIGCLVLLLVSAWRDQQPASTQVTTRLALVVVALTTAVVCLAWYQGGAGTPDGRLAGDGFRYGMDLILLLGTAGSLALLDTDQARTSAYQSEVPVLMLLALCGMMFLTAARDLMYLFIGVELMSIAAYVLAGVNRSSARSAEASIKYFLLGAFSSAFLLYGIALLYGAAGDTRLASIAAATPGPLYITGVALLFVGFAFKVAAVPFHVWTPDVYDGAPLPITAFMAACVKTAAFAMIMRVMIEGLEPAIAQWHPALWWLAALTMVIGNVVALSQRNLKRLLAYSSIAHAGYLLVAVLAYNVDATAAVVFYLLIYTLATMGAFAVLGMLSQGGESVVTIDDLAGLWRVRPGLALVFAVCLLAFLGFPLAGGAGFFAKWYVMQAALSGGAPLNVLVVVLVVASLVSAGYYLSAISPMFNVPRESNAVTPLTTPLLSSVVMGVCVVLILVLGVYPTPAARWAQHASLGNPPVVSAVDLSVVAPR